MPYPTPQPVDMQFPVGGLDNSLPADKQPPLTTWDLLNVRGFPPSSDRLGGGSREGASKLFEDMAGSETSRRITGLDVLTESNSVTDPGSFASEEIDEDWSGYSIDSIDQGPLWLSVSLTATPPSISLTPFTYKINSANLLGVSGPGNGSRDGLVISNFIDTEVGVAITIQAEAQATTSDQGWIASDHPDNVGPILADATLLEGVFACINPTGSNQIQCRIYTFNRSTGFSQVAASANITLTGDTTIVDWVIRMRLDGSDVVANFEATGVVSGPADLDVELTYTTSLTSLTRGGIGRLGETGIPVSPSTLRRVISRATFTRLIPPTTPTFNTINPASPNPYDANQFYVPAQWTSYSIDNAGVTTAFPAGTTSASAPGWVGVDDTAGAMTGALPGSSNADFGDEFQYMIWQGDDSVRPGIEWNMSVGSAVGFQSVVSPVFRASKDGATCLLLLVTKTQPASTSNLWGYTAGTNAIRGFAIVNGVVTDLGSIASGSSGSAVLFPSHYGLTIRITDDGTTIRMYVNGMLQVSFSPETFPNWTSDIGAALAANTGVGIAPGFAGNSTALNRAYWDTVRVVQGEGTEAPTYSNIKNRLAVYSPQSIEIGDTLDLTLSTVSGVVLQQPRPQSASFNRKFYAVDGERSIIVDPLTLTSVDWAGQMTDGVLPAECQLIEFFRGAAYLAATDSDPTIWYKLRTLDPLDADYGADPQTSTAVAGNNGEVGQPADAITALFAFSDDYLVFGMARSIGVLEGDPNYGGQFQIASREAGIVGPRAFCFDDRGNLYFVAASGLYRMFRGGFDPEPVGPRKLRRLLEELDYATNLIQLEFRASDRTVRIHVTPNDGETAATVFVYDTRTDAFYRDQLPIDFGPWSVARINGVKDLDRNLILGGNDGYIRRPDDDVLTDDGTAIPSYVEIPVPQQAAGLLEFIAQEVQFVLAEGGGRVTWRWFTAASPEQVRQLQPGAERASGVITGTGFQKPVGLRATGGAHKLRLESTGYMADGTTPARWALERVTALLAPTGRRRF